MPIPHIGANMCTVIYPNGKTKKVKNLGWLLKHAKSVETILINNEIGDNHTAIFEAQLLDGRTYQAKFQDKGICKDFAKKRVFWRATIVDTCT